MNRQPSEYPKIHNIFKRSNETKQLLCGEYSTPEIAYLSTDQWLFTEKIDGTNIRIAWQDGKVLFMGKTGNAQIPSSLIAFLQEKFYAGLFQTIFDADSTDVCLYGEGYGAKIQKGGGDYIQNGVSVSLFDIKVGYTWLKQEDVIGISNQMLIDRVPIVGVGTLFNALTIVEHGCPSVIGNRVFAEGIVAQPTVPLFDRMGRRIICKIKHRDFYEEKQ